MLQIKWALEGNLFFRISRVLFLEFSEKIISFILVTVRTFFNRFKIKNEIKCFHFVLQNGMRRWRSKRWGSDQQHGKKLTIKLFYFSRGCCNIPAFCVCYIITLKSDNKKVSSWGVSFGQIFSQKIKPGIRIGNHKQCNLALFF